MFPAYCGLPVSEGASPVSSGRRGDWWSNCGSTLDLRCSSDEALEFVLRCTSSEALAVRRSDSRCGRHLGRDGRDLEVIAVRRSGRDLGRDGQGHSAEVVAMVSWWFGPGVDGAGEGSWCSIELWWWSEGLMED